MTEACFPIACVRTLTCAGQGASPTSRSTAPEAASHRGSARAPRPRTSVARPVRPDGRRADRRRPLCHARVGGARPSTAGGPSSCYQLPVADEEPREGQAETPLPELAPWRRAHPTSPEYPGRSPWSIRGRRPPPSRSTRGESPPRHWIWGPWPLTRRRSSGGSDVARRIDTARTRHWRRWTS